MLFRYRSELVSLMVACNHRTMFIDRTRSKTELSDLNGELYYILTPIWHDRRVRSTICDTVIGLSEFSTMAALRMGIA
ncbi:hypothetical protein [Chamaesiphon sp. VAR_48_metabat_403]|uniref:hypothetical protein n=1 Tax=Chamaesiphon sp. VAR_48_metabat_403 TaxID=2964700 RepID=UPI00286D8FBE|nr:hypothetical protein [Chamaesiphon sp. VAR_48_metabat_403]